MPYLKIQTNINVSEDQRRPLLKKCSAATAEALSKPEKFVMVALETNTPMVFAGDDSPLAYLELKSLGLPEDRTPELSRTLSEVIQSELDINNDRVYIEFANADRHMWGWKGGTF